MGYGVRGAMYLLVVAACVIAYLVTSEGGRPPSDFAGKVHYVADGDTFRMRDRNAGEIWIRLHGVDAPGMKQTCRVSGASWPCGLEARRALEQEVQGKWVSCADTGNKDPYGRVIGICYRSDRDWSINSWLVDDGWAVSFRRYSSDYDEEEMRAKMARRGLWQGSFQMPELWRRERN